MKKLSSFVALAAGALLIEVLLSTQGVHAQGTGNAAAGKQAFMKYGCYECHGTLGQGNLSAGPAIAPHPIPYANFLTYIRAPRGLMPPFDARVLPAADAQNIFAYLAAIPAGPPASRIGVLQAIDTGNAGGPAHVSPQLARGHQVFGEFCIKCHASAPIGPRLTNVKAHENLAATIAQIKNPPPPMPKLYPSPLSEQDVNDVAAYVQSL
jgi:ubiquinol-cytochrome c reductase cytochrome c subunit